MDEVWVRVPDSAMASLDQAVVAKYLPEQAQASAAARVQRPAKPKPNNGVPR
jgi:hypothetical protein